MKRNEIWQEVELGLRTDKKLNPNFPVHITGRVGKPVVAIGKLMELAVMDKYEKPQDAAVMRKEAVNCIVSLIRFIESFKPQKEDAKPTDTKSE